MNTAQCKIEKILATNFVVLFMKGTSQFPQCGFSSKAIQLLQTSGANDIYTVNVLENEDIRQGIKLYSNWPTIPQLYIQGKFIGGSDIMSEMFNAGELQAFFKNP